MEPLETVLYNPYTVAIVGGTISMVVGGFILAVIKTVMFGISYSGGDVELDVGSCAGCFFGFAVRAAAFGVATMVILVIILGIAAWPQTYPSSRLAAVTPALWYGMWLSIFLFLEVMALGFAAFGIDGMFDRFL